MSVTCNTHKGKLGKLNGCMKSSAKAYVSSEGRAGEELRENMGKSVRKMRR